MIKILFICHGNICRSPMAEFVMKDMVGKAGFADRFHIASAATSSEESGHPVHPGTQKRLAREGISTAGKTAAQLQKIDYRQYDYLIGMDSQNIHNIIRISGGDPDGKVRRLLDFTLTPRDIDDPWYTGQFDVTYDDIYAGCLALFNQLGDQLMN